VALVCGVCACACCVVSVGEDGKVCVWVCVCVCVGGCLCLCVFAGVFVFVYCICVDDKKQNWRLTKQSVFELWPSSVAGLFFLRSLTRARALSPPVHV
jgi:hypothetical protein